MKRLIRLVAGATVCFALLIPMPGWSFQARKTQAPASAHRVPGYLGVYIGSVSSQEAAKLHLGKFRGAEIMGVDRDAPAGQAGLRPHDIIVALNGKPVSSDLQLRNRLHSMPAGRLIHLRLIRGDKTIHVAVKLASRTQVEAESWPEGVIFEDGFPFSSAGGDFSSIPFRNHLGPQVKLREFAMLRCDGLDVEPIGKQLASYFGAPQDMGLLVRKVEPKSVAATAGLEAGDVITAANGMPSSTLRGWLMVVSQNQGKVVKLKVIRNHQLKLIRYIPGGRQ